MAAIPAIAVFARAPIAGKTKTRLIPALGPEGAAALYRCFLLDTLESLGALPAHIIVAAADHDAVTSLSALLGSVELAADLMVQSGATLGERMANAVRAALSRDHRAAVVVGSDVPDLPPSLIGRALDLTNSHDLVIGPCTDGGYYLIGMRATNPSLFQGIEWSSSTVLSSTLQRAKELGLTVALLDRWDDVDTPADLESLRQRLTKLAAAGEPMPCRRTWGWLLAEGGARGVRSQRPGARIAVVIPALDEEQSIGRVIEAVPDELGADIVVVDNGSTDRTAEVGRAHGARVVGEPQRGYGAACLAGIGALDEPEVVAFLDADFSDDPSLLGELVAPILAGEADLVIGSRMLGEREKGALPAHSLFGNWLAGMILTHLYRQRTTDLGPFRAIRWETLGRLGMQDRGYGWTMEMQAKAARLRARVVEMPVPYRKRIGRSKITGSLKASVQAAAIILWTAFRLLRWRSRDPAPQRAAR